MQNSNLMNIMFSETQLSSCHWISLLERNDLMLMAILLLEARINLPLPHLQGWGRRTTALMAVEGDVVGCRLLISKLRRQFY